MNLFKSSQKNCNVATLIILISLINLLNTIATKDAMSSANLTLDQAIQQQLDKEHHSHMHSDMTGVLENTSLKRKRRYLEFPEGSSFQLVYDLIVGVVDYTNYLILGITVALAWELPSKPPSEILEDLTTQIKEGTLGTSRNDTVENIQYINTKPNYITRNTTTATLKSKPNLTAYNNANKYYTNLQPIFVPPMHYQYHGKPNNYYRVPNATGTPIRKYYQSNNRRKDNYYYVTPNKNPFAKWTRLPNHGNIQYYPVKNGGKYPWWNLPTRLKSVFKPRPTAATHPQGNRRFDQNINQNTYYDKRQPVRKYKPFPGTGRSEHRIYPIFGKRSIPDSQQQLNITEGMKNSNLVRHRRSGILTENLSKWDRIHIRHQRSTRNDLYNRIETYLNGRGSSGHHCVLRALCETGQKSHETKPGSFVAEIMRAIFTLPEPLEEDAVQHRSLDHKEMRYDLANSLKTDCSVRYHLCKDSLWSSHFVA